MTLGHEPLSPLSFLRRSATAFAHRPAVVSESRTLTYAELQDRVQRMAMLLSRHGISQGDRVAILAPNSTMMLEAHFAVPGVGAVLVALNTRLTAIDLQAIIEDAGARLLLFDDDLSDLAAGTAVDRLSSSDCEAKLGEAPSRELIEPDEHSLLSLSYTSGTTGKPKGAMYTHRGAYLQALAMAHHSGLSPGSSYLWTLPMFHCNGWCFPWAVTAAGSTHVCLRKPDPAVIWEKIHAANVTHFCAAPTLLNSIADSAAARPKPGPALRAFTGGASPAPSLLARMRDLNIEVTHLYGLTETYGPSVICDWQPEWSSSDPGQEATFTARQGVVNVLGGQIRVADEHGVALPHDGESEGEVQLKGNNVMQGYYGKPEETLRVLSGDGWFRTGDLGLIHPDGYLELRDRIKDVIISGGENISSVEVEHALMSHPDVSEAAVVGQAHEKWGEVPVAFLTLRGNNVSDEELIAYLRSRMARFKVPKKYIRTTLPKTPTGKVKKFELRKLTNEGASVED